MADAKTQPKSKSMQVKIAAPYKVYFNGKAQSVSAVNDTGPFDVLAEHHNFITLLSPCNVVVQLGNKKETIPINRGIMHVKKDKVLIFLDV